MSPMSTLLDVITDKASILKWQVPTHNTVQEVLTSITFQIKEKQTSNTPHLPSVRTQKRWYPMFVNEDTVNEGLF